jgi:hypothetical protein
MAGSMPNWHAPQAGIAGEVVLPGSPAYQSYPSRSTPASMTFGRTPSSCTRPPGRRRDDRLCKRHGLACATRSGATACRALDDPRAADRRDADGLGIDLGRRGHRRRRRTARRGLPVAAGAWTGDPRRDAPTGRGRRADAGRRARDPGPQLWVTSDRLLAAQVVLADGRVWNATSTTRRTCSGGCAGPAPVPSGW